MTSKFSRRTVLSLGYLLAAGLVAFSSQRLFFSPQPLLAESVAPSSSPPQQPELVQLGDPSLTAGIPGEGPLTIEQINAWLTESKNHKPLKPQLPLGLSAGSQSVAGLDKNPLTRAKIELGRQLYFDTRLSADNSVSCASCHDPDHGYAFDSPFGIGIDGQTGNRNSPTAYNRLVSRAQFYDGRAGSLEEQAVGPIANPIEMGNTHEACVATLKKIPGYQKQFERIFGDGVTIGDSVTIENVGRAIASYERVIVTGPSAWDYHDQLARFERAYAEDLEEPELLEEEAPEILIEYEQHKAAANAKPMSESAQRGAVLFFSTASGCTLCHNGANFTDELYHNLGVGMDKLPAGKTAEELAAMDLPEIDWGRYSVTHDEQDRGAFKTPTLRNVALTAPYMHDGSQQTLLEVVEWYDRGGHANPYLSERVKKLNLSAQDKADLVAYMESLTGEFPPVETKRLPQ